MINIVLCGGSGTRLWPVSRKLMPKQFAKILNNHSLFQETILRNSNYVSKSLIVTGEEHYFLAKDQLEEISYKEAEYLLESEGRNTAPAIALACLMLDYDDIVLVTPSDHIVLNQKEYGKVLERAKELASEGYLVTFGIVPTSAHTGYGYIEADGEDVKHFKEKPDLATAEKYVSAGNYYWNSGMFVFKAGVYLDELKIYAPAIYEASKEAFKHVKKEEVVRIPLEYMQKIPKDSIDYAVLEKSKKVKVVKADINWNDLGSFDSLYDVLPKDENGNTLSEAILLGAKNNMILSTTTSRNLSLIDVEDLIIVDTQDALLVSKKGSGQKVKDVVEILKTKNSKLVEEPITVSRPWGSYTVLEQSKFYKIKKIIVKPGKRLSLQKHYHRNEHWIVVNGTARVQVGDDVLILRENESTFIPMGIVHRLENPGKIPLNIIEVQVGKYLEEDDIIRLDDDFKRD